MESKLTKRVIAKAAAKIIVQTGVGAATVKALLAVVPPSEKMKIAEMSGALAGIVAGEKLEPTTDKLVDDLFDRLEARKTLKSA